MSSSMRSTGAIAHPEGNNEPFFVVCSEAYPGNFFQNLNDLLETESLCDVEILLEDGSSFLAHRLILATASLYFRTVFTKRQFNSNRTNGMSKVLVRQMSMETFSAILTFIYTSQVSISRDNIKQLLIAAKGLKIQDLVQICTAFTAQICNGENSICGQEYEENGATRDNNYDLEDNTYTAETKPVVPTSTALRKIPQSENDKGQVLEHQAILKNDLNPFSSCLNFNLSENAGEAMDADLIENNADGSTSLKVGFEGQRQHHHHHVLVGVEETEHKPFTCDFEGCGQTFKFYCRLARHRICHTGERSHRCDLCTSSFGRKFDLKRHVLRVHFGKRIGYDSSRSKRRKEGGRAT